MTSKLPRTRLANAAYTISKHYVHRLKTLETQQEEKKTREYAALELPV